MNEQHEENERLLEFAIQVVRSAGALALALQSEVTATRKADRTVVSEADYRIQALIREQIAVRFPTHAFLGEEDEGMEPLHRDDVPEALWILDPVDGTDSYLRQIPTWSISLGLAIRGEPRVGVVLVPPTGEIFYAVVGGQAFRNGQVIRVCEDEISDDAMLLIPSKLHLKVDIQFPGKLRCFGSTAAHLCFVAGGTVSGALVAFARPWDIYAAGIVLEAAGGGMFKWDGSRFDLGTLARERTASPVVVASHRTLAGPVFQTLQGK